MTVRIAAIGVLTLLIAVLLIWSMLPPLPRVGEIPMQQESWELPAAPAASGEAELGTIAARHLWGAAAGQGADAKEALTPPNWHIVGVYNAAGEMAVLLKFDNDPAVKTLKSGDALPGGGRILAVDDDALSILINGKRRILRTYRE